MTEHRSNVAIYSLVVSIIVLTITLMAGILRMGVIYGTVSSEHQQLFHQIHQLAAKKCP